MCGLSAVTSISDEVMSSPMRLRLGSMPSTHDLVKQRDASPSSRIAESRLLIMTGLKTLSSKWPCAPANEMAAWLPKTCAHTIVSASHCVGLTLPGMIDEPGSFSGKESSPSPQRGPLPRKRRSLAILFSEQASTLSAPDASTIASCAASASNLFGAVTNGRPVSFAMRAAISSAYPSTVLSPVPTAVPPRASSLRRGSTASTRRIPLVTCCAYPLNSCPSVSGVASCVCVRPILRMLANSVDLAASAVCSSRSPGSSTSWIWPTAAMDIAVGNESFDDWPMLT
mmetsp:Transcript_26462/g.67199  ORF Transcript_26462/g.67199 Transcript_26462/m.67199 type:complete len:284 (+) Transcript_26462:565-1416(+)